MSAGDSVLYIAEGDRLLAVDLKTLKVLVEVTLRPKPTEGPYAHRICSASSADGLTWTRDQGIRLEHASVPCAVADGDRVLLYYVDADRGPGLSESVGCAASTDGLQFEKHPFLIEGLPSDKAVDPCVLKDASGLFRLYYFASSPGRQDENRHEIHLALSEDGVRFREVGPVFAHPALVDPDVFVFDGTWFMYVFGQGGTVIASSRAGLQFGYEGLVDLPGWGTTTPVLLDDGRLRLYAFEQRKPSANAVGSFLSTDGRHWTREEGDRLVAGPDEQITDPFVIRWQGSYRMYFKSQPSAQPPDAPR
jgi:hypothetical protein